MCTLWHWLWNALSQGHDIPLGHGLWPWRYDLRSMLRHTHQTWTSIVWNIQIRHDSKELLPGHRLWLCEHCNLDLRDITLGQIMTNLCFMDNDCVKYYPDQTWVDLLQCLIYFLLSLWRIGPWTSPLHSVLRSATLLASVQTKRKITDSVLWQKPLHQQKIYSVNQSSFRLRSSRSLHSSYPCFFWSSYLTFSFWSPWESYPCMIGLVRPSSIHDFPFLSPFLHHAALILGEKGRYQTQSYDKSPYTNRNVKRAKWKHKQRHKKIDNTAVADRRRTVSWSNYGHSTGVVNLVYGPNLPTPRNSRVIKRTHV